MEARLADELEKLFPSVEGKWSVDGKTFQHQAFTPDGRSLRFALIRSIENYHAAITCTRAEGHVSARHRVVFNLANGRDSALDVVGKFKRIIDAELGDDFLRIVRHDRSKN